MIKPSACGQGGYFPFAIMMGKIFDAASHLLYQPVPSWPIQLFCFVFSSKIEDSNIYPTSKEETEQTISELK